MTGVGAFTENIKEQKNDTVFSKANIMSIGWRKCWKAKPEILCSALRNCMQ